MIEHHITRTGCISCNTEKHLEWLYVGDYGKENNLKANFLGLTKEINGVCHKRVKLSEKMVVTISTQKGCPMDCMFCDCPKVGFKGNATRQDLKEQVIRAIHKSECHHTKRFNLHLARMGEPTLNAKNVFDFLEYDLCSTVTLCMNADVLHPVFTTMMPKSLGKERIQEILMEFCRIKNEVYKGEAGLQLSINSTDEIQRAALFRNKSLSLKDISDIAKEIPMPIGRKYTLNFPVTKNTILDAETLDELFDERKFVVKITPVHETKEAIINGLMTEEGYYTYDVYKQFEQPLLEHGWDVIVFIPSKEEDEDRITCGNVLLKTIK